MVKIVNNEYLYKHKTQMEYLSFYNIFIAVVAFATLLPACVSPNGQVKTNLLNSVEIQTLKDKSEKGDAKSQCSLARKYRTGEGVAKDEVEAVKWYRKAAMQKFPPAQYNIGVCYDNGTGVAKDEVEAVKWYREAARQNFHFAQYMLGGAYRFGTGVARNDVEAVTWYRKAAEQGNGLAQNDLGQCYIEGLGITKNYVEAYKWILLGATHGTAGLAIKQHNERNLAQNMSREQIAEGTRRARDFRPHLLWDEKY